MSFADTITGWVTDTGGNVVLIDELCIGYSQPSDDRLEGGQKNVYNVSGQQVGSVTTLQFTRLMNTGDPNDYLLGPGDLFLIWALGDSDG